MVAAEQATRTGRIRKLSGQSTGANGMCHAQYVHHHQMALAASAPFLSGGTCNKVTGTVPPELQVIGGGDPGMSVEDFADFF